MADNPEPPAPPRIVRDKAIKGPGYFPGGGLVTQPVEPTPPTDQAATAADGDDK